MAPRAGPQLPPHLQSAEDVDRSIYDNGVGDSRGYYQDGAYTAAPSPPPSEESSVPSGEGPYDDDDDDVYDDTGLADPTSPDQLARRSAAVRDAYYASLTARFLSLRARLRQTPPPELVAALPPSHSTEVGGFGPRSRTFREWARRLRHTDPHPVQVAALGRQGALRLLRVLLGGKFVRRGHELRERTSRWIWALLARLPDCGQMDYSEVGWVRELGKRAVLMMVSMAQMAALREQVEGDLEGEELGEDDDEEEEEGGGPYVSEMVVDDDEENVAGARGEPASATGDGERQPVGADTNAGANPTSVPSANRDGDDENDDEGGEKDMDIDDGEVSDEPAAATADKDNEADIAAAKARLLARLEEAPHKQEDEEEEPAAAAGADADPHHDEQNDEQKAAYDEARARINMRATLNMILTVAGEFYGQRDLLEFRDPFPAL